MGSYKQLKEVIIFQYLDALIILIERGCDYAPDVDFHTLCISI